MNEHESCLIRRRERRKTQDESDSPSILPNLDERSFEVLAIAGERIGCIVFTQYSPRTSFADSPWGIVHLTNAKWSLGNRFQMKNGLVVDFVSNATGTRKRMCISTGRQYIFHTMPLRWSMSTPERDPQGAAVSYEGVFDENGHKIKWKGVLRKSSKGRDAENEEGEFTDSKDIEQRATIVAGLYCHQWRIVTWGRPEPLVAILCSLSLDIAHSYLLGSQVTGLSDVAQAFIPAGV